MQFLTKIITLSLVLFISSAMAQQRLEKVSQSINVNDDVVIDLNTSYTNLEIDTWNKDIIEIEAYIESDKLSEAELRKFLESWGVDIDASKSNVSIVTLGELGSWDENLVLFEDSYTDALRIMEMELAEIPEIPIVEPLLESLLLSEIPPVPPLPDMPEMPSVPPLPELPEGMAGKGFDYKKYQKEGEAYLEKWGEEYGEKYGEEYARKMEAWSKKWENSAEMKAFEKKMEAWGEKFGEEFGEKFGKEMEAWGKRFEKQMEQKAKRLEERQAVLEQRQEAREQAIKERQEHAKARMEARQKANEARRKARIKQFNSANDGVKKSIKIKMPKKAKLNINVRHGELKFAANINNVKANLSHTALLASSIDGSNTSINVSYAPVDITTWKAGELLLNFVDQASVNNVDRLVLSANSSNIDLGTIKGNAIIDGSFGDLNIGNIDSTFNNINITLENSDALLRLPNTGFNLQYKGTHSRLLHPNNSSDENVASFSTGNLSSYKTIVVNAKFSEVIMQ
ncbi:hypothetical protein [Mangrovimonas cancribranchiae]|uniref:Adhesin domain-containing protein n=1 Tax=Mangrovimonas cancribranchiae TaxID=3080055 RepID=A0AAU6P1N2_9FLAO